MNWIIIFAVIIIIFIVLVKISDVLGFLGRKKKIYNYRKKDFLMSRAEHEFFDILISIVKDEYYVFPQMHLSTILENKVVGQNWRGAFRHIDEKSLDFVICDKAYIKPLIAIELDDKTHDKEERKERDKEVERILNGANFPFLRFKNKDNFDKEGIEKIVLEKLSQIK